MGVEAAVAAGAAVATGGASGAGGGGGCDMRISMAPMWRRGDGSGPARVAASRCPGAAAGRSSQRRAVVGPVVSGAASGDGAAGCDFAGAALRAAAGDAAGAPRLRAVAAGDGGGASARIVADSGAASRAGASGTSAGPSVTAGAASALIGGRAADWIGPPADGPEILGALGDCASVAIGRGSRVSAWRRSSPAEDEEASVAAPSAGGAEAATAGRLSSAAALGADQTMGSAPDRGCARRAR